MKKRGKIYQSDNVYEAAQKRIRYVFDNYEQIVVSFSGGKDSTVLLYLCLEEAVKRNKKIYCFWLDQEFEYNSTFLHVDEMMKHPLIIPIWFQIHGKMATAINQKEHYLQPWNSKEEDKWLRRKKRISIKEITWEHNAKLHRELKLYGFRTLMIAMEGMFRGKVAYMVGLRAEESLDRFRAVVNHPGVKGIPWCTKIREEKIKFYPLYDWTFSDLWVYISKNNIRYNKMYDYFFRKGYSAKDMRISSLMNIKAFHCLVDIQEFEPKLYDALLDRIEGVQTAAIYGKESKIYKNRELPNNYKTWKEYRDFLLMTLPDRKSADIFRERFKNHKDNGYVWKQQVLQIQLNDLRNDKRVDNRNDPLDEVKKKWMAEL